MVQVQRKKRGGLTVSWAESVTDNADQDTREDCAGSRHHAWSSTQVAVSAGATNL